MSAYFIVYFHPLETRKNQKDYFGQKAGTTLDIDEPHSKSLLDQGIVEADKGDSYGPLMANAVETSIAALTKNIDHVIIKISKFLWATER